MTQSDSSTTLLDVLKRFSVGPWMVPGLLASSISANYVTYHKDGTREFHDKENTMSVQEAVTKLRDFIADNSDRYMDYQTEELHEAVDALQQAAQAPVRKTRYLWAVQNGTKTRFFTTGKMSLRRVQDKFAQKYGEEYQSNLIVKFIEEV